MRRAFVRETLLSGLLLLFPLAQAVAGEVCVWTGDAGDGLWSSSSNWSMPPSSGRGDTVVVDIGGVSQSMTNDISGLSIAQIRLLGANDACLTLAGQSFTLSPPNGNIGFTALTNHCSLVLDAPLRVAASCQLALYGQHTTFNGSLAVNDGVALMVRTRRRGAAADQGLVGECSSVDFNGPVGGEGAELHFSLGENGQGVQAYFNATVSAASFFLGEGTRPGSARFISPGNAIGRIVFSSTRIYADVAGAFDENTVVELGKLPDKSYYCWAAGGIYFAAGTEQVLDRLDGRPIDAKYGGQVLYAVDDNGKTGTATLRLRGSANAVTYVALADGLVTVWDPVGDYTQDFRDRVHPCFGALCVARGTVRSSGSNAFPRLRSLEVGEGATFEAASMNELGLFPSLDTLVLASNATFRVADEALSCTNIIGMYASVELGAGARFELPMGAALTLATVSIGGAMVTPGITYTGIGNPEPGDATPVEWIAGRGTVTIPAVTPVREPIVIAVPAGDGGLAAALGSVKGIRVDDVGTPIVISLSAGDHRLNGVKIGITDDHACAYWAPLTIRAADPSNPPRLLGGFPVSGWEQGRFPGRTDVWTADVTSLTNKFQSLPDVFWFDGSRMTAAQWPNRNKSRPYTTGFAYVDATYGSDSGTDGWYQDEIRIRADDRLPAWSCPSEGTILAYPRHNWSASFCPVVSVSDGLIVVDAPHEPPSETNRIWDRYTAIGMRENLDQPGEWYLDRQNWLLHFIPPDGKDPNTAFAALCTKSASIAVQRAGNLHFERLDFTCMREALSIGSPSSGVTVRGCRFHDLGGGDGCAVSMGAEGTEVTDCDFAHIGANAVNVGLSLSRCNERGNQKVENCYIHHVGETYPAAVGVSLTGQGNVVRNNLMHDIARGGIGGGARFCEISYNRIRHVNLTSDDCACIYSGGWLAGVGLRILHNWVSHNIGYVRESSNRQRTVSHRHFSNQAWGIYLDEGCGGAEVAGNLVTDCRQSGAMHLHSARWTTITNNVFTMGGRGRYLVSFASWDQAAIESRTNSLVSKYEKLIAADPGWTNFPALAQSPRGDATTYCDDMTVMMGTVVERNVFYYPDSVGKPVHSSRCLNLVTNRFDYNIYWPGGPVGDAASRIYINSTRNPKAEYYFAEWQGEKHEDVNSLVADPLFETADGRDGRLQPSSPAIVELGFAPLDVADKAGLKLTEWRTALPVEEEGVREHPEYLATALSESPVPVGIAFSGSTVNVGVDSVSADCWYALEKTTDLRQPFVVDPTTWTSGSALLAGDGELVIELDDSEPSAFYRVVVSDIAP